MGKHLVIIDGMGFVFRAFHAVRGGLTRADGLPTNALFGFAQMLVKVVKDLRPDACVVALDSKGKNWRHEIYPAYKSNRPAPDEALVRQLPYIQPLVEAFGLPVLKQDGVEADDIIATFVETYAPQHDIDKVTIVTSDKDLLQLVGRRHNTDVVLLDTLKDKVSGEAECVEKFGVLPALVADVQGLMGDSSDAIPGVSGVGPKTAADLVTQFGALEDIYADLSRVTRETLRVKLTEQRENAFISRDLARLKADVVLPALDFAFRPQLHTAAGYLRDELEFKTLAARLENGHAHDTARDAVHEDMAGRGMRSMRWAAPVAVNIPAEAAAWGPYETVLTLDRWQWWLAEARARGVVAFDTETTSLDPFEARLVGISLALEPGVACYVPVKDCRVRGLQEKREEQGDLFGGGAAVEEAPVGPHGVEGLDVVGDILALLADPAVRKVGHNLKYDWQVMAAMAGVIPLGDRDARVMEMMQTFDDTMLMSGCLDSGRWNHGLDELVKRHLGHDMVPYEAVCGKGKAMITFDKVPLEAATGYAAEDADATLRLYRFLQDRLGEAGRVQAVYTDIERPLLPVIVALEARGVVVDGLALRGLSADFATRMADFERQIWAAVGREFNVQSTQQLAVVLFDELKVGTPRQQKNRSTAVDILDDLVDTGHGAEAGTAAHTGAVIARLVLGYRQLAKLRSTYAEALVQQVEPATGRVHTHYQQMGAATGRFSSSDPNLQNIPIRTEEGRKIRKAFIPRPGWVMVSADYSQIELRLLAHMSGSAALKQAFVEGVDIHAYTASLVQGVPLAEVTKDQRRAAKFINFGLVYGMGARSLAAQIDCTVPEAQRWIDAYFARYDGVRAYMDANKRKAREDGYVETLMGRRVWLPDMQSVNAGLRAGAERAAINAPLQGSNADIIKMAMVALGRLRQGFGESGLNSLREGKESKVPDVLRWDVLMQVHDELVLECAPEVVDDLKTLLKEVMGGVVALDVPLVVEVGVGPNWEEAH